MSHLAAGTVAASARSVGDDDPALAALRADIKLLGRALDGQRLVYLDSAATSLTPGRVLGAMTRYYEESRANVHRGKHLLSEEASALFEDARRQVAAFVNADPATVVFTSGATASINLIALGLGLAPDDVVVSTVAEHHAVLLPFMGRARLRLLDVDATGVVDVEQLLSLVDERTRLVALAHASNVTGAIQDVAAVVARVRVKAPTARVLVDAAQSIAHLPVDVERLDADFVVFSGHKMLGPTGIGVLTGRREALDALSVELRGGGAVRLVDATGYQLRPLPAKLEPGTPDIAGAIGLGAAAELLRELDMARVEAHGRTLATRLCEGLRDVNGVQVLGPTTGARLPLVSVVIRSATLSADHVAMMLSDTHHVMVRSGHHCCHPYFDALSRGGAIVAGALRASCGPYTTVADVDAFIAALRTTLGALLR